MESAPAFEIRLFGSPRLLVAGEAVRLTAPPGTFPLLAYLLTCGGRSVARGRIADALWPERDAESARASVRRHLYHLERELARVGIGAKFARGRDHLGISLPPNVVVDVRAFENALADGDDERALALHSDDFLAAYDAEWARRERGRLRTLAAAAAHATIARARAAGGDRLVRALDRALVLEPWREELLREAMLVRSEAGDRAGAVHAYRLFATTLRAELELEPLPETRDLFERIAQVVPAVAFASSVPAVFTSFVGRTNETASVVRLLRSHRFVTVAGAPGVGKTRLVEHVAAIDDLRRDYPGGIVFVDLAAVAHAEAFETALLAALSAAGYVGARNLDDRIRGRVLLLIFDNCERAYVAGALLAERLLAAHARLAILVTSRRVLGARGESIVRLEPLPLPSDDENRADVLASDAIRLFIDRARAVRPELDTARIPLAAAVAICRRLDGIPLAIELAAARLRSLTILQLADLLAERFRVLTDARGDAHDRRTTLLTTYDVSFELLAERERDLFARLSVFSNGWTVEGAAAVAKHAWSDSWSVLEDLDSLVDQSLVVAPAAEGVSGRYAFLDSIREYAGRRLDDRGDVDETRAAHAGYVAKRYVARADDMRGPRAHELYAELEPDYPNVTAALAFLIEERHDPDLGIRLALAMSRYWTDRGVAESEAKWLRRGIDAGTSDVRLLADALQCLATITRNLGSYREAFDLYAEVLERVRESGDGTAIGKATATLGNAARVVGAYDRSLELAREAIAAFTAVGDDYLGAFARTATAATYLAIGRIADAEREFLTARAHFDEAGATADSALATLNLGLCAYYERAFDRAARLCTEALTAAREIGNRYNAAHGYQYLAAVEVARNDRDAAARFLDESITLATQVVDRDLMIACLETFAGFECSFGSPDRAAYALAAAKGARARLGAVLAPIDEPILAALGDRIAERADSVSIRIAGIEGGAASLDRALATVRDALRAEIVANARPIAVPSLERHDRVAAKR